MQSVGPSDQEVRCAVDTIRTEHPDFGIKRIWSLLKAEHGWEISEKRVKKFLDLLRADDTSARIGPASSRQVDTDGVTAPPALDIAMAISDVVKKHKSIEQRPSPRCYFSFTVCPRSGVLDDLPRILLFGGEYYDGAKNLFFNDSFALQMDSSGAYSWSLLNCENKPGTRSAHQVCEWSEQLFVFGGEWSSQNGQKFKLYDDLWKLDLTNQVWEKIGSSACGPPPSPRSGHRMVCVDDQLVLYGGARMSL